MKVVVGKGGKLETVGSADADAKSEAEIRAQIAVQRAELRRMIEGNEQFFDDPMGKPAEKTDKTSWESWRIRQERLVFKLVILLASSR